MNGVLCWDCNIIIFYLQCKNVDRESQQTVRNGGSSVPSQQIFMPISLLADRLHNIWRDMPEQIGSSIWLGLGFTFHPPLLPTLSNPQHSAISQTCDWKLSGITFNWLLYCAGWNFSKWSQQLCIYKYLICVMCHYLWIICVSKWLCNVIVVLILSD